MTAFWRRWARSLGGVALAIATVPALATARCPPEFGEKSPWVNAVGWAVLVAGFIAGAWLMGWVVLRARRRAWPRQLLILLSGVLGMASTWFVALAVALRGFFLTC